MSQKIIQRVRILLEIISYICGVTNEVLIKHFAYERLTYLIRTL